MLKDKRLAEEKKVAEAKAKADEEKKKKAAEAKAKATATSAAPADSAAKLPAGWYSAKDPKSGRTYYYADKDECLRPKKRQHRMRLPPSLQPLLLLLPLRLLLLPQSLQPLRPRLPKKRASERDCFCRFQDSRPPTHFLALWGIGEGAQFQQPGLCLVAS